MTDDFKAEIRSRAGVSSSGFLYRGDDVETTRTILTSRRVEGETLSVWWVNNTPEEIDDARARGVEDALDVVDEMEVDITGGISSSIGGAAKFSQSLSELGVILSFDAAEIQPQPQPITYELEWFDDNAGLFARVASLVNGEVRTADDDKIYGTVRPDGIIDSTGRDNLALKISSPLYSDEQEWYGIGESLNINGAVAGAVTVAHTRRAVGGSIQAALAEFPSFKMGFARGGNDVTKMDNEEMAAELHELLSDTSGISLERDMPYYLLLMDDDRWKEGAGIDEDEFLLAYNGDEVVRDPNELPPWIPL